MAPRDRVGAARRVRSTSCRRRETVLVTFDGRRAARRDRRDDASARRLAVADRRRRGRRRSVVIAVVYDGDDLDDVAAATGHARRRGGRASHARSTYRCRVLRVRPGLRLPRRARPARCVLPRRATPRHAVPAGLGRDRRRYTAVYPTASPGRLAPARPHRRRAVGRATGRPGDAPARHARALPPGTRSGVRTPPTARRRPRGVASGSTTAHLEVGRAGWSTSVQDGGRPGFAHLGVSPSGAVDESRRRALEPPRRQPGRRRRGRDDRRARSARAAAPTVVADSSSGAVTTLAAGDELRVDPRPGELWATLAVRGGIARRADARLAQLGQPRRIGPPPPRRRRPCSPPAPTRARRSTRSLAPPEPTVRASRAARRTAARLVRRDAWSTLVTASWQVTDAVSRVGVRLRGPRLERVAGRRASELAARGPGSRRHPGAAGRAAGRDARRPSRPPAATR